MSRKSSDELHYMADMGCLFATIVRASDNQRMLFDAAESHVVISLPLTIRSHSLPRRAISLCKTKNVSCRLPASTAMTARRTHPVPAMSGGKTLACKRLFASWRNFHTFQVGGWSLLYQIGVVEGLIRFEPWPRSGCRGWRRSKLI